MNPDTSRDDNGRIIDAEGEVSGNGGNAEVLPNGEEMPPPVPPAGVPVPAEMRVYAQRLRERIEREPEEVPGQLHIWMAKYTRDHTNANKPLSARRAFWGGYEEGPGPDPQAMAEVEKAKGDRLDKVLAAKATLTDAETRGEESRFKILERAIELGARTSKDALTATTAALTSVSSTVKELTGIVNENAGLFKQLITDHMAAINAYKAYTGGQPMPQGWTLDRIMQTAGMALEAFAPVLAKLRILEKFEQAGVPMGAIDAAAEEEKKKLEERYAKAAGSLPRERAEPPREVNRRELAKRNQKQRIDVINARIAGERDKK